MMTDQPLAELNGAGSTTATTPNTSRTDRTPQTMSLLMIALRVLAERAQWWATLTLVSCAWGFVLWALVYRAVPWVPLVVAAWIFTCCTHVPTWWRRLR